MIHTDSWGIHLTQLSFYFFASKIKSNTSKVCRYSYTTQIYRLFSRLTSYIINELEGNWETSLYIFFQLLPLWRQPRGFSLSKKLISWYLQFSIIKFPCLWTRESKRFSKVMHCFKIVTSTIAVDVDKIMKFIIDKCVSARVWANKS